MSVHFSQLVQNICAYIGIFDEEKPPINDHELNKRLHDKAKMWDSRNRGDFLNAFIQKKQGMPDHVRQSLDNFNSEQTESRFAVVLGCNNHVIISQLLKDGWTVEVVDNCQKALNSLPRRVGDIFDKKINNITLVYTDIETYVFPDNIQFIVAKDFLPYCNPDKITELWHKAYLSLEKGGRIAGNFFPHPGPRTCGRSLEAIGREVMGAWFTEKAVAEALLHKERYEIETCEYSDPRYNEILCVGQRRINFVGRKV